MDISIGKAVFSLVVAWLVLAGGIISAQEPAQDSLKVAVLKGPTGFGAIYLMEEKPVLQGGIETEYVVYPTPQEIVARIASREVDAALLPINLAAKLYRTGPGYKLGAITGLGMLFVLTNQPGLDGWSDLRGLRIYSVGKGATPDYLFRYIADRNGLTVKQDYALDFSYNAAPQLVQMFLSGRIDIIQVPEPFATQATTKGTGVSLLFDMQEEWVEVSDQTDAYPMSALVVDPDLAAENPRLVREFLQLYRASIERVNGNPAAAGVLIGTYGILPTELATPAIPKCNLRFIPAVDARASVERFLSVLLEFDPVSVGGYLPDAEFYFE